MYCIYCWNTDTKVLDSRLSEDWFTVKRRRECSRYVIDSILMKKKAEKIELIVEKSSGKAEDYNRKNLNEV